MLTDVLVACSRSEIGRAPVDVNDSQPYGSGALLLAGTATKSMIETEQNHR